MGQRDLLKTKRGGRGRPFAKGNDLHRNPGGKPFIKIQQRLSVVVAAQLSDPADAETRLSLNLPEGATWGDCVTKSMILRACDGDVGAAHFLLACTEKAKVLLNVNATLDLSALDRAAARMNEIINTLPALPEPANGEPQ
jgi:hypothetical protein